MHFRNSGRIHKAPATIFNTVSGSHLSRARVHPHVPDRIRGRRDALVADLERLLNARWRQLARRHFPGEAIPPHRIEFSKLITASWAIIYYRRHLVRLSPYLFLLEEGALARDTHWEEFDATLKHELVHAYLYARDGEVGHPPEFQGYLQRVGVDPNGDCDRGPTNVAYRHVYACGACGHEWRRRVRLTGKYSCGTCAPGRFDPDAVIQHVRSLPPPYERLADHTSRMAAAIEEGMAALERDGGIHRWVTLPIKQKSSRALHDRA